MNEHLKNLINMKKLLGTPFTNFSGLITRAARKDFKSILNALSGEFGSINKSEPELMILLKRKQFKIKK